jgi:hypothetical protein
MGLKIIDDLKALVAYLEANAEADLAKARADHPELEEVKLAQIYVSRLQAALPTINPVTVAFGAQRVFEQIKTGRTGFDPDHAGGG